MDDHQIEQRALECQDRIETMTHKEVLEPYEKTRGEPGDQWSDLLAADLQDRGIDV